MAVSDYSTTPGNNTSISGLAVTDSTVADTLDNIIRQMMADIRAADDANLKTTAIGTTVQGYDATLAAFAGLSSGANVFPYFTAADVMTTASITPFARTILDDADASAARTTLGLGSSAVAVLIDDDTMDTATATNVASAESVKAYVDANSGGWDYTSSNQTITAGGSLTLPHSIGSRPTNLFLELYCVSSEDGYTTGDYVPIPTQNGSENVARGVAVTWDATNINIRFGSNGIALLNFTTGVTANLTVSNWQLIVRASA